MAWVSLWIVNCQLHFQVAEVHALKSLGQVQRVAVRVAASIQPPAVIKADRVDHQRIAVPFSDGVSQPGWLRIVGELAAVGIYLAEGCISFVQHHRQSRRLDDLVRSRRDFHQRHAFRKTVRERRFDY